MKGVTIMSEETNKVVAAVAAPATKRMAREPIFKTRFSFTDANMARVKYRNGVSKDRRYDTKIKGLCVEVKSTETITFYAYKSVHMYNKKQNKWAPNVIYRKMFHWAKNTGYNCEAAREKVSEYVSQIKDSKSKADSEITVEYLVRKFIKTGLNGFTLKDDSKMYKPEVKKRYIGNLMRYVLYEGCTDQTRKKH